MGQRAPHFNNYLRYKNVDVTTSQSTCTRMPATSGSSALGQRAFLKTSLSGSTSWLIVRPEHRARIRWVILTPTECMTADALTKVMTSPVLMEWLTTGHIKFWNTGHPLEMKRLPPTDNLNEHDLIEGDKALEKKDALVSERPSVHVLKEVLWCCNGSFHGTRCSRPTKQRTAAHSARAA